VDVSQELEKLGFTKPKGTRKSYGARLKAMDFHNEIKQTTLQMPMVKQSGQLSARRRYQEEEARNGLSSGQSQQSREDALDIV
jgi:hypothetical protein